MAKGLVLACCALLGILGIAIRGACEERTTPAQASAFLEKRLAEATARGGEKERRRVLLDDLAAWTDGRDTVYISSPCLTHYIMEQVARDGLPDALPLLRCLLERGSPDFVTDNRRGAGYELFFKGASDAWLRLATKGFTDEERALYALGCLSDPKAPPLEPEAIAKLIRASPTPAIRAKVFEYLENDKRSKKEEDTLDLWTIEQMNNLLFEDGYFKATEEELVRLLRGRAFMGRRVAFEVFNRSASDVLVPMVMEWLKNGNGADRALGEIAVYESYGRKCSREVLAIAFEKLKSCPFDLQRPAQLKERTLWLQIVSWCTKDLRSIELFRQEKKNLEQVNLLRRRGVTKDVWMEFCYQKNTVEKALGKWEKE